MASLLILLLINILAIIPTPSTSSNTEETIFTEISYPTDDSWIEHAQPHCNHGTEREIHVKTSCDTIRRAYLKFTLTTIPTDKEIVSAKLYLYCVNTDPKGDIPVNIHKTEDNWNEHTITWNNAPKVGTPVASTTIVDKKNKFYSWDITPYAQTEHNNDKTLSVVAKFPMDDPERQDSNPQYERLFASKETPPKHKRPYLKIVYTSAKPPIASFTYSPNDPVTYETVTFNASASYDPNGHIVSYTWNFGDENTTTTTNPTITHVYTNPGNFTTTLTVTDNDDLNNSTTTTITVSNPTILRVSLPNGTIVGPNPDLWQNEGWLLNLTEPTLTFHVRVNSTSHVHTSYDTRLVIALDNTAHNNLINLTIKGITIPKTAFQHGTPKPYNIWTWPNDVYPTWFNDTHVNLGTIPPNGYKEATVSATFFGLTTIKIHLDAYAKVIPDTPTRARHIAWSPHSEDSTVLFQPKPPPLSVSISPTSVVMGVGQSVTFTSSVSGGTPPHTYQWYRNGAPISSATASTWTFFPTYPSTYEVYLIVADDSDPAESNHVIVTVNPSLAVSINPLSVIMDIGQSQTFTSSVSGGTPSYTYQWYLDDTPVGTAPTWVFTPTSPSSYEVYLDVTDAVGMTAQSNIVSVTANPTLTVSISPTTVAMNLDQSVTFQSTVSGGTPPHAYQWYLNDITILGATSNDWTFTPTSTGFYTVYVNVMDYVSVTTKSNVASITVSPELSVSINPISATINLGDSKTFTSSVSGGAPPYTYQWHLNGAPVSYATSNSWTFTPTTTGSYIIYLNVTDSLDVTAKSNIASVVVNPPLEVSIVSTSIVINIGQYAIFYSSVSGGTSPFTYQWYLNDVPVSSATASTWTFYPTSPGTYEIYLIVTDSSDPAESNHIIVTVNPPLTVSISPTSVVMEVGQSQTFTSSVSGGTPPYTYQWHLDDIPVGTAPTWVFTPISPGSYEVYLNVTDNISVTAKSNIASVTVNPALSVSIFPMSVAMDVGESQPFMSIVSGGVSPYTYKWYLNGTAVPDAIHSSWTFTPTTMGYYLVHLRVTDDVNISVESDAASVIVRGCPKAAFTYSPLYPYVNETVTFNASASTPNGGVISNYTWFFGDNEFTIVTDPVITHAYTAEGNYTVTLVVTDSEGPLDNTSKTITVYLPELHSSDYTACYLGEEFLIDVIIVNATHLSSFEFKLGYNTTLLDAINITEGPFLKSFGSTSTTMEIHDPEGYALINIALLISTPPAEGNGILATIKFRVIYTTVYPETVACNLELYNSELNDPTGQLIPHTIVSGLYEFVPLPPQPPSVGPAIDVYTQKLDPYSGKGPNMPSDAFGPQEEVILYAYVSYNCEPAQNKLVIFEVKNPSDEPVTSRTATSNAEGIATSSFRIPWEAEEAESIFGEWTIYGSFEIYETTVNDTCAFKFGWLIEITHVKTVDTYGGLKSSFTKGEHIHFNLTVGNIAFTSKIATLTLTVYDECDVPIGHIVLHDWLILPGTTEIFIVGLQIPEWAYIGIGTAYANAYTDLPQTCGTPYCPETSTTFTITKP